MNVNNESRCTLGNLSTTPVDTGTIPRNRRERVVGQPHAVAALPPAPAGLDAEKASQLNWTVPA